jgi:hypothetical protein
VFRASAWEPVVFDAAICPAAWNKKDHNEEAFIKFVIYSTY